MVGFNFAPVGWALCNGQILPISQNTALFSLLGTQFGGNGTSNFALPNMQGNAPMHFGSGAGLTPRDIGESGGEAAVMLLTSEIPAHPHVARSAPASTASTPGPTVIFGGGGRGKPAAYAPASAPVAMSVQAVGTAGNDQPHNNMPPYLTMNFIIALQGVFPPRS
jgi:microcystin-dependent protein